MADFLKEIVKLQEKFSSFSGKFYIFFFNLPTYTEKLLVFTGKCDDFFGKNPTVFTGTLNDLDFLVKTVKFSCKNW